MWFRELSSGAGIIPGLLHQDPRYVYKGTGRFPLVLAIRLRTLERVLRLQVRAYKVHQRWPELRVEFLCRARDCDRRYCRRLSVYSGQR
jgi:hypothetical protein